MSVFALVCLLTVSWASAVTWNCAFKGVASPDGTTATPNAFDNQTLYGGVALVMTPVASSFALAVDASNPDIQLLSAYQRLSRHVLSMFEFRYISATDSPKRLGIPYSPVADCTEDSCVTLTSAVTGSPSLVITSRMWDPHSAIEIWYTPPPNSFGSWFEVDGVALPPRSSPGFLCGTSGLFSDPMILNAAFVRSAIGDPATLFLMLTFSLPVSACNNTIPAVTSQVTDNQDDYYAFKAVSCSSFRPYNYSGVTVSSVYISDCDYGSYSATQSLYLFGLFATGFCEDTTNQIRRTVYPTYRPRLGSFDVTIQSGYGSIAPGTSRLSFTEWGLPCDLMVVFDVAVRSPTYSVIRLPVPVVISTTSSTRAYTAQPVSVFSVLSAPSLFNSVAGGSYAQPYTVFSGSVTYTLKPGIVPGIESNAPFVSNVVVDALSGGYMGSISLSALFRWITVSTSSSTTRRSRGIIIRTQTIFPSSTFYNTWANSADLTARPCYSTFVGTIGTSADLPILKHRDFRQSSSSITSTTFFGSQFDNPVTPYPTNNTSPDFSVPLTGFLNANTQIAIPVISGFLSISTTALAISSVQITSISPTIDLRLTIPTNGGKQFEPLSFRPDKITFTCGGVAAEYVNGSVAVVGIVTLSFRGCPSLTGARLNTIADFVNDFSVSPTTPTPDRYGPTYSSSALSLGSFAAVTFSKGVLYNNSVLYLAFSNPLVVSGSNLTGIALSCSSQGTITVSPTASPVQRGSVFIFPVSPCYASSPTISLSLLALKFAPIAGIGTNTTYTSLVAEYSGVSLFTVWNATAVSSVCTGGVSFVNLTITPAPSSAFPVEYSLTCGGVVIVTGTTTSLVQIGISAPLQYPSGCRFDARIQLMAGLGDLSANNGYINVSTTVFPCVDINMTVVVSVYNDREQALYLGVGTNDTIVQSSIKRSYFSVFCNSVLATVGLVTATNSSRLGIGANSTGFIGQVLILNISSCPVSAFSGTVSFTILAGAFTTASLGTNLYISGTYSMTDRIGYSSQNCTLDSIDPTVSITRVSLNGRYALISIARVQDECSFSSNPITGPGDALFYVRTRRGSPCGVTINLVDPFNRPTAVGVVIGHCDDSDLIATDPVTGFYFGRYPAGGAPFVDYGRFQSSGASIPADFVPNGSIGSNLLKSVYPPGINQTRVCGVGSNGQVYQARTGTLQDYFQARTQLSRVNWSVIATFDAQLRRLSPSDVVRSRPFGVFQPSPPSGLCGVNYTDLPWFTTLAGSVLYANTMPMSNTNDRPVSSAIVSVYVFPRSVAYLPWPRTFNSSSNTSVLLITVKAHDSVDNSHSGNVFAYFNVEASLGTYQVVVSHSCTSATAGNGTVIGPAGESIPFDQGVGCSVRVLLTNRKGTTYTPSVLTVAPFGAFLSPEHDQLLIQPASISHSYNTQTASLGSVAFLPFAMYSQRTLLNSAQAVEINSGFAGNAMVNQLSFSRNINGTSYSFNSSACCQPTNVEIVTIECLFYDRVVSTSELATLTTRKLPNHDPVVTQSSLPVVQHIPGNATQLLRVFHWLFDLYVVSSNSTATQVYQSYSKPPVVQVNGPVVDLQYSLDGEIVTVNSTSAPNVPVGVLTYDGAVSATTNFSAIAVSVTARAGVPVFNSTYIGVRFNRTVSLLSYVKFDAPPVNNTFSYFTIGVLPLNTTIYSVNGSTTTLINSTGTYAFGTDVVFGSSISASTWRVAGFFYDQISIGGVDLVGNTLAQTLIPIALLNPVLVANDVSCSANEGEIANCSLQAGIEYNFTGNTANVTQVLVISLPLNGTLRISSTVITSTVLPFRFSIATVSTIVYTPNADFAGLDVFYVVYSGALSQSPAIPCYVTILNVEDAPVATSPILTSLTVTDALGYKATSASFRDSDVNDTFTIYIASVNATSFGFFYNTTTRATLASANSSEIMQLEGTGQRLQTKHVFNTTSIALANLVLASIRLFCFNKGVTSVLSIGIQDAYQRNVLGTSLNITRVVTCNVATSTSYTDSDTPPGVPGTDGAGDSSDSSLTVAAVVGATLGGLGLAAMLGYVLYTTRSVRLKAKTSNTAPPPSMSTPEIETGPPPAAVPSSISARPAPSPAVELPSRATTSPALPPRSRGPSSAPALPPRPKK